MPIEVGGIAPVPAEPPASGPGGIGTGGIGTAVTQTALASVAVDELNLRPLDVTGALQILIAEVQASLTMPGERRDETPPWVAAGAWPATPVTAPLVLVQLLLKHLPDDPKLAPAAWLAATTQAEASLRLGMDKAIDVVTAWRDVPAGVVDVARDARAMALAAVEDEPPNLLWLRPEWLGLAPRMERFRRRRRHARRHLQDPDWYPPERES